VRIRAEPAEVFALVSDLRRKARLNPNIRVIRVELESEGPVREGSVFSHRFQKGTRIIEYRSRCVRCIPPRLFESRGETNPPFEVRVSVEPIAGGCQLTQEEALEVTPDLIDAIEPPPGAQTFRDVMRWLTLFPGVRPLESELRTFQRERLLRRLTGELEAWLDAIRRHVEVEGRADSPESTLPPKGSVWNWSSRMGAKRS
jgi:hypothetical protein